MQYQKLTTHLKESKLRRGPNDKAAAEEGLTAIGGPHWALLTVLFPNDLVLTFHS